MRRYIDLALRKLGYELRRLRPPSSESTGFKLFDYRKSDGTFDYEEYKRIQKEGNVEKMGLTWVMEENIKFLAGYLVETVEPLSFGICHGTRRGNEQRWFRQYLSCEVVGTEIADSASQFPHTIQWDFHKPRPEWVGSADFIYSNSFDHSYDPEACLNTWMDSLRVGGVCILEHSNRHGPAGASERDPFGAELEIMPYLITRWGRGRFVVREILDAPQKSPSLKHLHFIVVERRPRQPRIFRHFEINQFPRRPMRFPPAVADAGSIGPMEAVPT